ncbi:hypothetical protein CW709_05190 [Candidatus Bathyarchaeota archaeon]|nr:MAG: hypothetical protein CW709_05190 [Candidatus Bathyarchaeota archaeon]
MKVKTVVLGVIIAVGVFLLATVIMAALPTSRYEILFYEKGKLCKPDIFYNDEFKIDRKGVLQIKLSCENPNANVYWYVFKCSRSRFLEALKTGDFSELIYASNTNFGNEKDDAINIEAGTYTFAFVQAAGTIGVQPIDVEVYYWPS